MPSAKALSNLLASIYDAAADPALWSVFLQEIVSATGGNQAAILMHDMHCEQHSVSMQFGVSEDMSRLYAEYYGARDLWYQRAHAVTYSGWLGTSEQICPVQELRCSEFYSDFLRHHDMGHALWSVVEQSTSRITNLGVYRGTNANPFDNASRELLRFLTPHLKQAFKIHLQLADLKSRSESLAAALDAVAVAIILIGANGRILSCNRAAEHLLERNDGLTRAGGRLCAKLPADHGQLETLITLAGVLTAGKGFRPAGGMLVSRSGGAPLQVLVTPARGINFDSTKDVSAIVFVADPSRRIRPASEILQALFGMTAAECRVALLLADGHTPLAIGELIGVTANTIKTQLANIYRKTGTVRQSQLVRLLTQLASVNTGT